jgi:hypothetical protein
MKIIGAIGGFALGFGTTSALIGGHYDVAIIGLSLTCLWISFIIKEGR